MASNEYAPAAVTYTQLAAGTASILVAARPQRTSLWIQPQTEDITINFGATAGVQATGFLVVGVLPFDSETIAINTVLFTFVSTPTIPTATEFLIGADVDETAVNMAAQLNASTDPLIALATYAVEGDRVNITSKSGGTFGNTYQLADSSFANVVRGGATLSGGSNLGNGFLVPAGSDRWLNAGEYASFREDVYAVSPTNGAQTVYLEGIGGA